MYQVTKNSAFSLSVILVSTDDGYTPVTGIDNTEVSAYYQKESDTTLTQYSMTATEWDEVGQGIYQINFTSGFSDELGRFTISVEAPSASVINYLGQTQIVSQSNILGDIAQLSAAYDGSNLSVSIGMERDGLAVTSPTSASYVLYKYDGTQLTSGANSSPDAQGVFVFTNVLSLDVDTVPYVHATVTDAQGTITTRQFLPVIG